MRKLVRRAVVVAIGEDAIRLALRIVELVVAQQPEEADEAEQAEEHRDRDQDREDVHWRSPRRSAFRQTTSELADMVMAAKSGVTDPVNATGTVMKL